jgi:anti-sigma-K factor RskA
MSTSDDDKDVLAAEYVLGTLDADDRANVQMLLAIDPAFAAIVGKWEGRLGELHQLVDAVEPPTSSWEWIAARIAGAPPSGKLWLPAAEDIAKAPSASKPVPEISAAEVKAAAEVKPPNAEIISLTERVHSLTEREHSLTERVRQWQSRAAIGGALAACLVGLVVARELWPGLMPGPLKPAPMIVEKPVEVIRTVEVPVPSQRMAEFVAVFQKDDASPAFLLTVDVERRTLSVRKVGAEQPPDKSYQLWILPAGATAPRSLGLLEDREFTVRRALADYDAPTLSAATFGISLEPQGGSPAPTGPVLHGKLLQTTPAGFPSATP